MDDVDELLDGAGWVKKVVWTCSYGRVKEVPPEIERVRISLKLPAWYSRGHELRAIEEFMPSGYLMGRSEFDPDWDWRSRFRLEMMKGSRTLDGFVKLPDECVLLCFEKDGAECHRKLVWEMLNERFGVDGGEWPFPPGKEPVASEQGELLL